MSFALCEFEFRVFYWQRCSDVYFTYSGLLVMHYSKRYEIATLKARGLNVFLLLCQIFIFMCVSNITRLLFSGKCNKLSAALQRFFLLDVVVNSRGLQPLFFISWIPRWDDTGDHHHIFIALHHIYTSRVYYLGCRNFFFLRLCGSASRVWRLYVYELSFCPLLVNPYLRRALREFLQI